MAGNKATATDPQDVRLRVQMDAQDPEEGGIFPIWPFRLVILGTGVFMLVLALILHFTAFHINLEASLTCFTTDSITYNGLAVDVCAFRTSTNGGTQCGSVAADLFCQRSGFVYSYSWQQSTTLVNNTIALGNSALGGEQTFSAVCCDSQSYWPTPPRWLLWVAGLLLLYPLSVLIAKLLLLGVEVILVGLVVTEALYFFSGFEGITKQVAYSVGLVVWTDQAFWHIWCGSADGRECEQRWLHNPQVLLHVAQCLLAFQLGRLGALIVGKAFSWAYFFRNQLPTLRRVLKQERYLSAMSTPHWARALIRAQEEAQAEADAAEARGKHPVLVGGAQPDGAPVPKFHGGSVLAYLRQDKLWFNKGGARGDGDRSVCGRLQRAVQRCLGPGGPFNCCRGPGRCAGGVCTLCCGPAGCCRPRDDQEQQQEDDLTHRPEDSFPGLPSDSGARQGASLYPGSETAADDKLAGLSTQQAARRHVSGIQFAPIPEVGPFPAPASAPPKALFKSQTMATGRQGELGGALTMRRIAGSDQISFAPPTSRLAAVALASGHHHSRLAGALEAGSSSFRAQRRQGQAGGLAGSDLRSVLSAVTTHASPLDSPRPGADDTLHTTGPSLLRRSMPVVGSRYNELAVDVLTPQQARAEARTQKAAVRKMAADLNADLVALDVGGVGALRKFRAFVRKYQEMSDEHVEKETTSLAQRLFANLKAYLKPHGSTSAELNLLQQHPGLGARPSGMDRLGRVSCEGRVSDGALKAVLGDQQDTDLPPSHRITCGSGVMEQPVPGGKEPAAHQSSPPESQPADVIYFTEFASALRRARRQHGPMGLTRTSSTVVLGVAKDAWLLFDRGHEHRLTEEDVRATLKEVYRSRRNLALSIKANQAVCSSLQAAAAFVIQTALIFVYMAIFGVAVAFSSGLDFFKTYVLAFSFIFGDYVKALFQSALFLFAQHPFDCGDSLKIGDSTWVVDRFDLQYTVLLSSDGFWATQTNVSLMNSQLINLSRSKNKWESIKVKVPATTSLDVLAKVKEAMLKVYVNAPGEYIEKTIGCSVAEMVDSQSLTLAAKWQYSFPPAETGRMGKAKSPMQDAVIRTLLAEGVVTVPLTVDVTALQLKQA